MQKQTREVSLPVVRRLPRYYRFLCGLKKSGILRISSIEIARQMGLTASQIRQDLNCFGGFGQQGYGYNVEQLTGEIEKILFLNDRMPAILIGLGNLGRALMGYLAYEAKGISLVGLFDQSPKNIAEINPDIEVLNVKQLDAFCHEHNPQIAILCIPETNAQQMAERLVELGIKGFWNFSHVDLRLSDDISVENVHLGDSLMTLDFQVQTKMKAAKE